MSGKGISTINIALTASSLNSRSSIAFPLHNANKTAPLVFAKTTYFFMSSYYNNKVECFCFLNKFFKKVKNHYFFENSFMLLYFSY